MHSQIRAYTASSLSMQMTQTSQALRSYLSCSVTKKHSQIPPRKEKKRKPLGNTSYLMAANPAWSFLQIPWVTVMCRQSTNLKSEMYLMSVLLKTSGCGLPWEQMFCSSCVISDFEDAQAALSESACVCARAQGFEQVVCMLSSCVWCVSGSSPSELRDTSAVFFVRQKRNGKERERKGGGRKLKNWRTARKWEWGDETSE